MKKILILSHRFDPDIGGIETVSEMLATAFVEQGYDIRLLTWTVGESTKEYPFIITRNPGVKELIKEYFWADVVFENNPCLRLAWPNLLTNRPSVIALHTWLHQTPQETLQSRMKQFWLRKARQVIACSDAVRKGCFPEAAVVENAYNEKLFRQLPGRAKTKDFVFLGRLVSDKGVDLAIQAFHLLRTQSSEMVSSTLTIIGDGPERHALQTLACDLKVAAQVHFIGSLQGERLVSQLNEHRFLLVPSVWEEPFGMVVLEGMACGCIPIVADGGGLPEAVGTAGVIFKRGDVHSLVASIRQLWSNTELQQQLRRNAVQHLEEHQSPMVINKYLELIKAAARAS